MIESCGMKSIKFTIFAFNFVFVLIACGLIGTGIYIQVELGDYYDFFGNALTGPGIVLIVIGFLIFVVATFGCCGALTENYCCIMTFAVSLAVSFIIQVTAVAVFYSFSSEVEKNGANYLRKAEYNYGKPGKGGVTAAWDILQRTFECCGSEKYNEWYIVLTPPLVPTSCCTDPESTQCDHRTQTLNRGRDFHTKGCANIIMRVADDLSLIIVGVSIGLGLVQVVGIIIACCLGKAIRKEYKVL